MKDIVVCAVGLKGWVFLQTLTQHTDQISAIWTYDDPSDLSFSFQKICGLGANRSIPIHVNKKPVFDQANLIFLVGWQFLLQPTSATMIVLHDSLLPTYRGFIPTVTALIRGEAEIGVTAILGTENADEGPILGQRIFPVDYPITIEKALGFQASLMAELATELESKWRNGTLSPLPQDASLATYSLWRDLEDYTIDWTLSANAIARFVDASGYPYEGARTTFEGEWIILRKVTLMPDLIFEIRSAGKIWQIRDGSPIVVCGTGLIKIDLALNRDQQPVIFKKVRSRLGQKIR